MKLILIALASVVALFVVLGALAAAIGAFLPSRHEVSRSLVVAAPAADLYRAVTDVANAPLWRRDVQRVELLGRVNGRLRFREHARHGAVTYEVTADQPPRLFATEIVDRDLGYSGSWTYSFLPEATGTRVTIVERGEVSNVLFRFMSRYIFGHTSTIDRYLAELSAREPWKTSPR